MTIAYTIHQTALKIPKRARTPIYDAGCVERLGAPISTATGSPPSRLSAAMGTAVATASASS
ncbi:hypothetical protein ACFU90_02765 [Streptomyces noursei]|uniref:hypothetical protein n=1 Tax=Streptomyces noursei TaxID=1971 RepID=UPI003407B6A2